MRSVEAQEIRRLIGFNPGYKLRACEGLRFSVPRSELVFDCLTRPAYLSQKSSEISACVVRFGPS